jgi:proteasome accessory factor A
MIDLQYHDIRPGKGLYYKLEESEAVEPLVTDDEISKAIYDPPKDTRAYFRGCACSAMPTRSCRRRGTR